MALMKGAHTMGCSFAAIHNFNRTAPDAADLRMHTTRGIGMTIAVLNLAQRSMWHNTLIEQGWDVLAEYGNPVHDGNVCTLYGYAQKFDNKRYKYKSYVDQLTRYKLTPTLADPAVVVVTPAPVLEATPLPEVVVKPKRAPRVVRVKETVAKAAVRPRKPAKPRTNKN